MLLSVIIKSSGLRFRSRFPTWRNCSLRLAFPTHLHPFLGGTGGTPARPQRRLLYGRRRRQLCGTGRLRMLSVPACEMADRRQYCRRVILRAATHSCIRLWNDSCWIPYRRRYATGGCAPAVPAGALICDLAMWSPILILANVRCTGSGAVSRGELHLAGADGPIPASPAAHRGPLEAAAAALAARRGPSHSVTRRKADALRHSFGLTPRGECVNQLRGSYALSGSRAPEFDNRRRTFLHRFVMWVRVFGASQRATSLRRGSMISPAATLRRRGGGGLFARSPASCAWRRARWQDSL